MRGMGRHRCAPAGVRSAGVIIPDREKGGASGGTRGAMMKTQAIRIDRSGPPDVMQVAEIDVRDPGPDEVRVRQHAVGLNYIDLYYRSGLYPRRFRMGWARKARAWSRRLARA